MRRMAAVGRNKPTHGSLPRLEYGQIAFLSSPTCLFVPYFRGQAYLAAGQGKDAAAEFQKILDHSGMVWNCWTGALARLGVARANALQAKTSTAADADSARVRALGAYKAFLTLWKDADPDIPIYQQVITDSRERNKASYPLGCGVVCALAVAGAPARTMSRTAVREGSRKFFQCPSGPRDGTPWSMTRIG